MKILLLGSNGQVGWELQRALAPLGGVVALSRHSQTHCGDLSRVEDLIDSMRTIRPDVIVNAAAHTAVDKAETEVEMATLLNTTAPGALASEAAATGAWLVHYSTDYVFDGSGDTPWVEDAITAPLNVYGCTKRDGEQRIRESGCKHLIFRTSWVYGARGGNFARTMLRLAGEREQLSGIDDQIGAPTGADLIADVTAHAVRQTATQPDCSGTYHLAAGGHTSWHGYARFVFEQAREAGTELRLRPDGLKTVTSAAFPTPAPRPHNSRLDTQRLQRQFNLRLPDWQDGVTRMLTEVLGR